MQWTLDVLCTQPACTQTHILYMYIRPHTRRRHVEAQMAEMCLFETCKSGLTRSDGDGRRGTGELRQAPARDPRRLPPGTGFTPPETARGSRPSLRHVSSSFSGRVFAITSKLVRAPITRALLLVTTRHRT